MRKSLIAAAFAAMVWAGSAQANVKNGLDYFMRGEYGAAVEAFRPLAEAGDPSAQYFLGIIYLNGYAAPPTPDAAVDWLTRAAEQGQVEAQTELARMYRTGDGVKPDAGRMAYWYSRAADLGDVGAQLFLADILAYGYGVDPDPVEAYKWYIIAMDYWGDLAAAARDAVVANMTSEQIVEGEARARHWLEEHATGRGR